MAQITSAELQAEINSANAVDAGSYGPIRVDAEHHDGTNSFFYCTGSPNGLANTRSMWCQTTTANVAVAQAAEVLAAMTSDTTTVNGNVDPDIGP